MCLIEKRMQQVRDEISAAERKMRKVEAQIERSREVGDLLGLNAEPARRLMVAAHNSLIARLEEKLVRLELSRGVY